MKNFSILVFLSLSFHVAGQSYTSYFTGNPTDTVTVPLGGVCLMGGATENNEAMKWFLKRANGGDILVLRTSGSDGYNNYLFYTLGIPVHSVETIVFNSSSASNNAYIQQKISNAEAIWFAGGDQWDYISYWRNTPVEFLVNNAIQNRKIAVGGTSAGMAILGGFYFSAQNGTVTSAAALANPYNSKVTVDSALFIRNNYLQDVITDTHYDNPDRKGRQVAFLARIYTDFGIAAKGIACDEYTAVCIDTSGLAKVYGKYPTNDDNAYFIQPNCELSSTTPENCSPATPLDWNLSQKALKVYKINGTNAGVNTFNLNDWTSGSGGVWEHWYVNNGVLNETAGTQINCAPLSVDNANLSGINIYPNPCRENLRIETNQHVIYGIEIINISGVIIETRTGLNNTVALIDVNTLRSGLYFVLVQTDDKMYYRKFLKE